MAAYRCLILNHEIVTSLCVIIINYWYRAVSCDVIVAVKWAWPRVFGEQP